MDIAKIRRLGVLLPFPGPSAVAMLADEIDRLRAELAKVTNELTIERRRISAYKTLVSSMEKQLSFHRSKAADAEEAIRTLDSERGANALLTAELETARKGEGE